MRRWVRLIIGLGLGAAWVTGCGSSGGGGGEALCPGGCLDVSGTFSLGGTCPPTSCEISQAGCDVVVSCNDGSTGSGSTGDGLRFGGGNLSCRASLQSGALVGTCSGGGTQCSFSAQRASGGALLCLDGSVPGASSGGKKTVGCRQKAGADGDEDCVGQAGRPRKLDCDSEAQTSEAVAAGCVPEKPGDSDVCCPTGVGGAPDLGGE